MSAEQPRNSFRAAVLRGEKPPLVVTDKAPRRGRSDDSIDGKLVARSEQRRSNHRGKDRHRLADEAATVHHGGRKHKAELVNLSAGGAMIRCDLELKLWDQVDLVLGEFLRGQLSVMASLAMFAHIVLRREPDGSSARIDGPNWRNQATVAPERSPVCTATRPCRACSGSRSQATNSPTSSSRRPAPALRARRRSG